MCGIIGITGNKVEGYDEETINSMLFSLSRRGPDDNGILKFNKCILGQTRLSIIDLANGHQPMKDNQKNIAITFNGEIYNYKELRKDLKNKGYKFSTNSDTEVILKTYIEYNENCPKYLDGMFAFAIWDEEKRSLFMARDRFGKKPFCYAFDKEKNFIFASEIKAIFASGRIKGVVNYEAIDNYLTLMYIPPRKTAYENIHVLPPAHQALLKNGKFSCSRYWKLESNPLSISYEGAKKEIKRLFENSVRKRMLADVEIGALLSGGVDSTLVCAYAQKYSSRPLKTFSVGYENHINELPFAKQASEKIGTKHYTLQAKSNLMDELIKVIEYMDEPHADSSNFPQHLISGLASTKVKVALSGDGADEIFMGYGWYWKYWNTQKHIRIKNALFSNPFKEHIKNISIFSKTERKKLWKNALNLNEDILPEGINVIGDSAKKINYFDITAYLPGQLLTKIDRTSMMHSIEIRCPFLDYKLAEFVYNLPENYKMDRKNGKIILKEILSEIMPKKFAYRRKQGFGAPIAQWLKAKEFKTLAKKTVGNTKSQMYSFLNPSYPQKLMTAFYNGKNEKVAHKLWVLICLELWLQSRAPKIT